MTFNYEKMTPDELRGLMANAQRLKNPQVYAEAFDWLCRKAPNADQSIADMNGPLTQRFWQAVTAAEQVRTEANGKTTRLQRTRNKAASQGIIVTMADLAMKDKPSEGFHYLLEAGLSHLVFEYVIAEMPDRFEALAVSAAHRRLDEFGIARPGPRSPA